MIPTYTFYEIKFIKKTKNIIIVLMLHTGQMVVLCLNRWHSYYTQGEWQWCILIGGTPTTHTEWLWCILIGGTPTTHTESGCGVS